MKPNIEECLGFLEKAIDAEFSHLKDSNARLLCDKQAWQRMQHDDALVMIELRSKNNYLLSIISCLLESKGTDKEGYEEAERRGREELKKDNFKSAEAALVAGIKRNKEFTGYEQIRQHIKNL